MSKKSENLAILIDADNAQPSIIDGLMQEVAKLGLASVKRIYGDWTHPRLNGWKETLLTHSIQPMQQFSYTSGKNSTDSALIIDAMDLLYTGKLNGFCIVSSDSDFTKLAARLREGGMVVYGFGEKKTPNPFVVACDKFIYTEVLRQQEEQIGDKITKMNTKDLKRDTRLVNLLRSATESSSDESGWAHLGAVGSNIIKQAPEFDARNYGYEKLSELVSATKLFDMDEFFDDKLGAKKSIYIRDNRKIRE
jgi:uncharacterized LabA/DUF88 family protein